jgi:predicted O-linked N-acetylglucosamine transferase (SPINDLY family)
LKTILSNYDKNKFEIFLFLNQPKEDQTTKEFIELVDKSVNISRFEDIQVINNIRELNIDIMIDLMGYTSTNRIELFKNRIAKIQILWMGYCNTSGLKNMDYIISDKNLIYPEEEKFYAEKVIFLNSIWNCHCGLDTKREYYDPPLNKNKYVTFGSFNNFDKITPAVIDVWSKILKSLKNSKLILKSAKEIHSNKRIKKLFEENGIKESVIFLNRKDEKEDHLNAYKEIDIALDTFPYNGVTTSFESIWMGVPVITLAGYNFNSRCGESINKNLNIEYLIAKNENEYIAKAVDLSNNLNKYLELRKEIFEKALKSPLFDGKNYSKNFFQSLEDLNN